MGSKVTVTRGDLRRGAEAAAFVGAWAVLGFAFRLRPNTYLLVGVPLTLAFQLLVRRQSLLAMWVCDAPRLRRVALLLTIAYALAMQPLYELANMSQRLDAPTRLWLLCAVVGAFGAGYATAAATGRTWRELGHCLLVAGGAGASLMVLSSLTKHLGEGVPWAPPARMLRIFATSLAKYVPVVFVLEEVVFRGVLDPHVEPSRDPKAYRSAAVVSCLWGLWHLPLVAADGHGMSLLLRAQSLAIAHMITGIPLSIYWRRSGNLLVPGVAHAFIDAVRNALVATG